MKTKKTAVIGGVCALILGVGGAVGSAAGPVQSGHDVVQAGTNNVQPAQATPNRQEPDDTGTAPAPFNPCTLMSASEASGALGASVTSAVEAPQGPTCIYTLPGPRSATSTVTISVETEGWTQATGVIPNAAPTAVAGLQAVCGKLGREMMFVRLSANNRILHVTAPCASATKLAALVVPRLPREP